SMSHLVQPFVFIRVKQNRLSEVAGELEARRFDAQPTALANAFSFLENTDLQSLDSFTKGFFEIQDLSSQMVCDNLPVKNGTHWWDCCSGAGGKSLLMADQFPDVFITCSDIRPSILENLQERVHKAELKPVSTLLLDATTQIPSVDFFDGILVDAPCSGSGTWRRNPDNLSFFKESSIYEYQEKQLSILRNVNRSLKKNGFLVYITCSVFRAENEEVIAHFSNSAEFQIIEMKIVPGFINNADSMFVAVLQKVS
ncbi:MAG: RsmB/NOP family class I SAM-dependent RNA methyltransferase, partial [Bacteroidota bacterium]